MNFGYVVLRAFGTFGRSKEGICFIGNYNLPSSCAEQLLWRCVMADSFDASWSWNKNQNAIVF